LSILTHKYKNWIHHIKWNLIVSKSQGLVILKIQFWDAIIFVSWFIDPHYTSCLLLSIFVTYMSAFQRSAEYMEGWIIKDQWSPLQLCVSIYCTTSSGKLWLGFLYVYLTFHIVSSTLYHSLWTWQWLRKTTKMLENDWNFTVTSVKFLNSTLVYCKHTNVGTLFLHSKTSSFLTVATVWKLMQLNMIIANF
jgi:hypothetical protein